MDVARRRVALVTGSSRGLGAVIAQRLAADGFMVAVNSRSASVQAQAVVDAVRTAGGVAEAFAADVTDQAAVAGLVRDVSDRLGDIAVLVLNATGPQPHADLLDASWDNHLDQLRFFVQSPILLARAIVPGMQERGYGRIVHIDSEVADRPPPGRSAYATAKQAQIGLSRSWARELAPHGITVNSVAPGFVPVERHESVSAEERDAYVATVPTGRMGTAADIAHAVSFLASDASSFITGQRIVVDGGRSLHT